MLQFKPPDGDHSEVPAKVLLCRTVVRARLPAAGPPALPAAPPTAPCSLRRCEARMALEATRVLLTRMHCWQEQGWPELAPTGQDWDFGMEPMISGWARSMRRRSRRVRWLWRLVCTMLPKSMR